ncbi:MAG: 23S rRNA (uracil(1939)-C(5))-methyltransferase RlmD [Desulfuromonadia bacterium]
MTGTLLIDSLAHGGSGVGRCDDGKVCFVPHTAPGDRVSFRVVKEKRGFREGELISILDPSPLRVVPPCPNAGRCGGCQWQHLRPDAQLEAKRRILEGFLSRLPFPSPPIEPIPSPVAWGYRFRAQFKLRVVAGRLLVGFYGTGSHRVVPLPESGCPVLTPRLNDAVRVMEELVARSPAPDTVPQVDIAHGDGGGCVATIHLLERDHERMISYFSRQMGELPGIDSLLLQRGRKKSLALLRGDGALSYVCRTGEHPLTLRVSQGGFFQGNLFQNRAMVERVNRFVSRMAPRSILDLYCGNGNFSLSVASPGVAVTGVEEYAGSVEDARFNARSCGIDPEFLVGDATEVVQRLVAEGRRYELVIVDPPRTGAPRTIGQIPLLGPDLVVSVSCDPATLVRDLRPLLVSGYRIDEVLLFDLFPQTFHIETVMTLVRG